jgi:hypothetical protein
MLHIADAEGDFHVANVNPDFCKVHGKVVAFDISQVASSERTDYSPNFRARGQKVIKEGSIIRGTLGNAGKGVKSGVSTGAGHAVMTKGTVNFHVNGKPVCRHLDECLMNVEV